MRSYQNPPLSSTNTALSIQYANTARKYADRQEEEEGERETEGEIKRVRKEDGEGARPDKGDEACLALGALVTKAAFMIT